MNDNIDPPSVGVNMSDTAEIDQWLAARKREALNIDPKTAEVTWVYGQSFDPYDVRDLPEEYRQVQRHYFARAPGSEIWVVFDDLPDDTRETLLQMHESQLAFPAGLTPG